MKHDRNPERQTQRVDKQKANRPKVVSEVPETAVDDDTIVVMDDEGVSDVLLRVRGQWVSLLSDNSGLGRVQFEPEITAQPNIEKVVRLEYRIGGHPRSRPTRFSVKFVNASTGAELTGNAAPTNVSLTPNRPSRNSGDHIVEIRFTPQSTGEIRIDLTLQ